MALMEKLIDIELEGLRDKKVIICVSGGVDSMVLLDLICKSKYKLNIDAAVCHFEHGIRGKESELDMELVKQKCREYGLTVYVRREDIPVLCGGRNVEEFARNRRYGFFYECLKNLNADYLVLAHHRGDNCETVLMNIIRGCGIKGLCAMEQVSGSLVRPLLGVSKEQIYEYARENGIEFREDATNADVGYFRNFIRHELIPFLQEKNPKIEDAVERLRQIASLENDFLEDYVAALDWIIKTSYGYDIEVEKYLSSHEAIKRRSVFYVLKKLSGKDYDYRIFDDIDGLTSKETGKRVCAPRDVTVYKEKNVLSFVLNKEPDMKEYSLDLSGVTDTPFGSFAVEPARGVSLEQVKKAPKDEAYFSLNEGEKLMVRARRKGDKIKIFGGGSKKLKDIMIDKKIPVFLRDSIPVVCIGDEIVWVPLVVRCAGAPFKENGGLLVKFCKKADGQ